METITANAAKTSFGELLLKTQKTPVQISKNGKAVAVVVSADEYAQIEQLKLTALRARVEKELLAIEQGELIDAKTFFEDLAAGKYN